MTFMIQHNSNYEINLPPQAYTAAPPLIITNPFFRFQPTFMPLNVYLVYYYYPLKLHRG